MYQQFIKKCYPFANRLHKSAAKVQLFSEITKNSLFFFDFLGNYIRVDTDFIFKTINVNVRFLLKIARFTRNIKGRIHYFALMKYSYAAFGEQKQNPP